MTLHRACSDLASRLCPTRAAILWLGGGLLLAAPLALAESIFRSGFEPLEPAPAVNILRDDRVATLEMDYDGENAWGQWWTM
ncbi:MAG: hypothetical protein KDI72_10155, partial [Xanthomonadales bacterium]|nr:hypothetical protein [Xanthomonadales bacterium]